MLRAAASRALGVAVRSLDKTTETLGDLRRTAAFLRGRLEFRPRDDDVYVVTYPRSGTTWMQYLLHLLVTPDAVEFTHLDDVSPWFERSLAIGTRTAADFEAFASPRIFKSHLPWGWLPGRGRYVVVVRDVTDVVASYHAFYRAYLGFTGSFEEFFDLFLAGRLQYGSWFEHVEGWSKHRDDPRVHLVRYEDLARDCPAVLADVARFLHVGATGADIADVAARADLTAMKSMEHKFDHATAVLRERGVRPGGFIRRGTVGAGAPALSPDQREALDRAAGGRTPRVRLDLPAFLH